MSPRTWTATLDLLDRITLNGGSIASAQLATTLEDLA